jgi:hypothetical protein
MKIKHLLLVGGVLATMVIGLVGMPQLAFAQSAKSEVCAGAGAVGGDNCAPAAGSPSLTNIVAAVVNILSLAVGIAAVVMIIYAGFRYVSSGGDSGKISGAKDTLIYACVGLVIAGFAQFIVMFVLNKSGI